MWTQRHTGVWILQVKWTAERKSSYFTNTLRWTKPNDNLCSCYIIYLVGCSNTGELLSRAKLWNYCSDSKTLPQQRLGNAGARLPCGTGNKHRVLVLALTSKAKSPLVLRTWHRVTCFDPSSCFSLLDSCVLAQTVTLGFKVLESGFEYSLVVTSKALELRAGAITGRGENTGSSFQFVLDSLQVQTKIRKHWTLARLATCLSWWGCGFREPAEWSHMFGLFIWGEWLSTRCLRIQTHKQHNHWLHNLHKQVVIIFVSSSK